MQRIFRFTSKLWLYPGESANWHFVSVPKKESEDIKKRIQTPRRGFGSIRVEAMIGKTVWKTSIFPDSKEGAYLLPVKADVRKKEELLPADVVRVILRLV